MAIVTTKVIAKIHGYIPCKRSYMILPTVIKRHYYFLHYAGEKNKQTNMNACDKEKFSYKVFKTRHLGSLPWFFLLGYLYWCESIKLSFHR